VSKPIEAGIQESLRRIGQILNEHPEGMARSEIQDALATRFQDYPSDRTLRRRLSQLEDEGRLIRTGRGRSTRYRPASDTAEGMRTPTQDQGEEQGSSERPGWDPDLGIPLTAEGRELQRLVRLPRPQRPPCTYDREFLERYVPGETWYLPEGTRAELLAAGQTPEPVRPAGTFARDILDRLLIDLSWASSRLEGNTYSRLDTQNLLEHGIHAEGKSQEEAQMILNHRMAIRMLVDNVEEIGFNRRTLLGLHAALSENLVADPGEEGALRERPVDMSGTLYTPSGIPQVLKECFELVLEKARNIPDQFEQSFFLMVHIPYLQPFVDVNQRTSRLAAIIPFIRANLCPLSFVDVPHQIYVEATLGVYERTDIALLRDLYAWAYRRSCIQYRVVRESLGTPDPIRLRFRDQLAELVRHTVRSQAPVEKGRLRLWAQDHDIETKSQEGFVERAMDILLNLTEGAAHRYGLSEDEMNTWRAALSSRDPSSDE